VGFDIDTSQFCGNEAPQASIDALSVSSDIDIEPKEDDPRWTELLPKVDLGPNSRHLYTIPESDRVQYVKLKIYPDGGVARFRVYGHVVPVLPPDLGTTFDLAHVFAGGRVEIVSDQHFGVGSNIILPGRGKDMSDGWETKRSRTPGHKDYAIIKLGTPGFLEQVEIDTNHYMGNFPDSCELQACFSTSSSVSSFANQEWVNILPRTKLGPHRRHFFQLENVRGTKFSHVKLTIWPDGGLKRLRIIGRRIEGTDAFAGAMMFNGNGVNGNGVNGHGHIINGANGNGHHANGTNGVNTRSPSPSSPPTPATPTPTTIIPALPLTPEAFAPFGQVVQAYADHNAAPRKTKITPANQGSAFKFHKLAPIRSSYPLGTGATSALSIYRCKPIELDFYRQCELNMLERHPYTNQAFIPMGPGDGDGLTDPGKLYLVVVAKNAEDGGPDLGTLRAFVATAAQGIVYDTAVWHQPMTVLWKDMDFTCVETQIGNGDPVDCEIVELDKSKEVFKIEVPGF